MKKIILKISCFILAVFSIILISCGKGEEQKEAELYESGVETALVMEEMAKSEEFKTLLNATEYDFSNALAEDYNAPVSVYSISTPTFEQWFQIIETARGEYEGTFAGTWSSLSDELKEQVKKRFNFSTIVNLVLSDRVEVSELSVSSVYRAYLHFDGSLEEEISYLYAYETGASIIVTFSPIKGGGFSATGQFLLEMDCSSLAKVRDIFESYNCEVNKIK
ncbi:MAG: hypothetical protein IJ308_05805 [Clostridia bacterium]|nr:hypothetical protein [Clostridia bacterium]